MVSIKVYSIDCPILSMYPIQWVSYYFCLGFRVSVKWLNGVKHIFGISNANGNTLLVYDFSFSGYFPAIEL